MAEWYFDKDADLKAIENKTVGIFGYGNQGQSQALNLRDCGQRVIVGSREDNSHALAQKDGFDVFPLSQAAAEADILFLLVPDEVMPAIFDEHIAGNLSAGDVLVFASGYNIHFGHIQPPDSVDVVMIAPRMIGKGVRDTFVSGEGFPSLIAVQQDASGEALNRTLALSKGIGSTKMGVIMSSFEEETIVDLFSEQTGWLYSIRRAFDALVEAGCTPETVLLELYASGEGLEIHRALRDIGLWKQLPLHSRTSQYGQEVTSRLSAESEEAARNQLRDVINHIRSGAFDKEWQAEQNNDFTEFDAVRHQNMEHPIIKTERDLYRILGRQGE